MTVCYQTVIYTEWHEKLCVNLVIYKDHTRMHGQQNTKNISCVWRHSNPSSSPSQLTQRGDKHKINEDESRAMTDIPGTTLYSDGSPVPHTPVLQFDSKPQQKDFPSLQFFYAGSITLWQAEPTQCGYSANYWANYCDGVQNGVHWIPILQ